MSDTGPAPGWYGDPSGNFQWRWWSGADWTTHTANSTGGSGSPLRRAELVAEEQRSAGRAAIAALVYAAVLLAAVAASPATASRLAHWSHELRIDFQDRTTANFSTASYGSTWEDLLSLPELVAIVFLLIWQYRSAKVAAALGYPAHRSPGWGVGCWFVPVVQLWMPYGAVRDLLPSGHSIRRILPYWWLSGLASGLLASALVVTLAFAHPVGLALLAPTAAADVALGVLTRRIVVGVAAQHKVASEYPSGAGAPFST